MAWGSPSTPAPIMAVTCKRQCQVSFPSQAGVEPVWCVKAELAAQTWTDICLLQAHLATRPGKLTLWNAEYHLYAWY